MSGGTALAQYDSLQNRQILQNQQREASQIQQQQTNERALQSYDLRNRAIRTNERQAGTLDLVRPPTTTGINSNRIR
ncbi:hypothetical protein [Acuticoccus sediminis]|uniref:hypothetical protein n=1 Tax=Acuticoccus sediminis TaxID=2184697 RepID=UPI001391BC7C|nr:hypothetical protein [Acuticoccus sediminis]